MTDNPGSRSTGRGLHFGALPAGYPLGQYRFQSVLGVGGFGITYRAMDDRLRRPVAIKEFLPSDFATRVNGIEVRPRAPTDQEMFTWGLKRFLDEARVLAALNDAPNIVHVYDYLEANGTGYMVMELIEGEPLDKVLARIGKIPPPSLPPLLQSLLRGLEAVHRAGYLHRDIKPGNVLVRPNGEPVLVDFGAARMSMGKRTQIMTSIYSPGYAPPEQYAFGTADANKQGPWGDLYALAATLYHAITGAAPADSVRRLAKDNYVPLTQAAAGQYPPGFLAAIDAALALPIDRRPQSVPAWGQMLFGDSRAAAYPGGPPQQPAVAGPGPMSQGGPYAAAGPASAQGAYAPAGAAWGAGGTYGNAPPGQGFDAAIASRSGAHVPAAGQMPPAFAPAAPPPPPYSRSPAAPPPAKRSGGAGLWIALGALVVLLTAGGAGAYYYLCVLKTYCGSGTEEDPSACYEDLARVRAEIQRVLARLPGQPAPSATPNLSCKEELAKAKADLQRLQELERSKPTTPTPIPPVVTPKPPAVEPQPPIPPLEPKPPVVEPRPPTPPVDITPRPPAVEPQPLPVDPKPPVVEPKPPTPPPIDVTPVPKPPIAEPKPPPVVAKPPTAPQPPPPTEPPSPYAVHEGRWFGSANLTREQAAGRCAPAFTLSGMVRDNIFTGSSSVHGSASIRIRSRTKRVTDMSLPGVTVKSTNGTFDAFTMETSTGCIYAVRMFRQ